MGVWTSMQIKRLPPTRTSILATGRVAPVGPNHSLKRPGSVHIRQMRSTGASKVRSITSAAWECLGSVMLPAILLLSSELREVVVHPIEPGLPDGSVLLGPGHNLLERRGIDCTRPVLGSVT